MTVTIASFRATFAAFQDALKYPDPIIQFWLDLAVMRHNADRWGELLDTGLMLYVAHELSVDAASVTAPGAAPGQVAGTITSRSVGGVSYSRENGAYMGDDAGYMNMTTYGLRWWRLMRLVGAGPVQVGAPNPNDLVYAAAWPGPG
jgi:hypothetical protein